MLLHLGLLVDSLFIRYLDLPSLKTILIGENSMKGNREATLNIENCTQLESIVVESGGCQFVTRIRMKSRLFICSFTRLA